LLKTRASDFGRSGAEQTRLSNLKPAGGSGCLGSFGRLDVRGSRRNVGPRLLGLGGEVRRSFNQYRRKVGIPGGFGKRQEGLGLTHEIQPTDHDVPPFNYRRSDITRQAGNRSLELHESVHKRKFHEGFRFGWKPREP
jgi:hypothetical protein